MEEVVGSNPTRSTKTPGRIDHPGGEGATLAADSREV